MQAKTILKFILAILASLALLCVIFPKDGIYFFGTILRFPSIAEVLKVEKNSDVEAPSPQEIISQRKSELNIKEENEFTIFCETSPARIYLPNNDVAYLDPFFRALDDANLNRVRIMHYGDSQLECDRISCDLRSQFQSQFGGMGVGLIPVQQTIATYTLSQQTTPNELPRGLVYGSKENRVSHSRYGIMGQMTRVEGSAKVKVSGLGKNYPTSANFQKVTVNARSGNFSISTSDGTIALKQESPMMYSATLANPVKSATVTIQGDAEVYGIMLDGNTGVSIDNIPMRGCSGTIFTSIDTASMAPFFKKENVKLIILQYGGNSVPYLKTEKSIESYKKTLKQQIEVFKELEPTACILFIGPADMATKQNGKMQTYPQMENVVNALRDVANESGIAFWDMFSAMGGRNSMVQWVNARPQLAGSDHIHFTPKGAKEISSILFQTFQLYYKFYRFRNGLDASVN